MAAARKHAEADAKRRERARIGEFANEFRSSDPGRLDEKNEQRDQDDQAEISQRNTECQAEAGQYAPSLRRARRNRTQCGNLNQLPGR